MSNAPRDENGVPVLIGALEGDGLTIVPIVANAATNELRMANASTGVDQGQGDAPRDENGVPVLMGVSAVDGVTPVAVYADATGKLLVDNT